MSAVGSAANAVPGALESGIQGAGDAASAVAGSVKDAAGQVSAGVADAIEQVGVFSWRCL